MNDQTMDWDGLFRQAAELDSQGRFQEAASIYKRMIEQFPDRPGLHRNLGTANLKLGNHEEGFAAYDNSLALGGIHHDIFYNKGVILHNQGRYQEALEQYDRAVELRPDFAMAHSNRGVSLKELKRFGEEMESYETALRIRPDFAMAHWNKALSLLLHGAFKAGWTQYEWRFKTEDYKNTLRHYPQPRLITPDVRGKTVLLYHEQGLGDTIQFCRYAKLLKARGARVVLEVQPTLVALIKTLDAEIEVVPAATPLPPFDLHSPLMSLPMVFETGLESIPAEPSYLKSSPGKVEFWKRRLGPASKKRIGLAWSGRTAHKNDANRSASLEAFRPLLDLPFEFHCLQKEIRETDRNMLDALPLSVHANELGDFSDTAALLELMDCVVSVDTSVIHLAGALGKEACVLLPYVPDWRWLMDRSDSPWYPSVTLYRQDVSRSWRAVMENLGKELASMR
jgi:hypothetical protein